MRGATVSSSRGHGVAGQTGSSFSANAAYTNARLDHRHADRRPRRRQGRCSTPDIIRRAERRLQASLYSGDGAEAHLGGSLRYVSAAERQLPAHLVRAADDSRLCGGRHLGRGGFRPVRPRTLRPKNLNNAAGRTPTTGTKVFGPFLLFPDGAIGTGVIRSAHCRPRVKGRTLTSPRPSSTLRKRWSQRPGAARAVPAVSRRRDQRRLRQDRLRRSDQAGEVHRRVCIAGSDRNDGAFSHAARRAPGGRAIAGDRGRQRKAAHPAPNASHSITVTSFLCAIRLSRAT